MNETINVLMKRKSVRVYEDREIPQEAKEAILAAAMRAPTRREFHALLHPGRHRPGPEGQTR